MHQPQYLLAPVPVRPPPLVLYYRAVVPAHADKLHSSVLSLIQERKSSGVEIPQGMLDVWEFEHAQMVEGMAYAKHQIDLYG